MTKRYELVSLDSFEMLATGDSFMEIAQAFITHAEAGKPPAYIYDWRSNSWYRYTTGKRNPHTNAWEFSVHLTLEEVQAEIKRATQ